MSDSHGNTPAAWSAVVVAMIGFVIAGVGLMMTPISLPIFWVGMAVIVVAIPLFVVMNRMGLGARH